VIVIRTKYRLPPHINTCEGVIKHDLVEQLDQVSFYHTFADVNATSVVAGLLFESLGHARLMEGITLTLRPMIKSQWRTLFHWKSRGEQVATR
jgi:hypothetical protein